MPSRILRQDDTVFKVCGHVLCADERGDWVGDVVDEEDWVLGFGLLEAWGILAIYNAIVMVVQRLTREDLALGWGERETWSDERV
jgi:hypothetical protein